MCVYAQFLKRLGIHIDCLDCPAARCRFEDIREAFFERMGMHGT